MTKPEPCRMCGSENVRVDLIPAPRRLSGETEKIEKRVCLNRDCNSNKPGHPRRLGEVV